MNSGMSESHYPFDNAAPQARDRFANLSTLYDEVTRRHLDRFGIDAGLAAVSRWAPAAGPSQRFMSERVGPTGHVVATDINIDWMAGSLPANVELRRHDIGVDPLPERAFDIVHARAVLTFVPERQSALTADGRCTQARRLALGRGAGAPRHRGVGSARRARRRDCAERPSAQSWRSFAAAVAIHSSRESFRNL